MENTLYRTSTMLLADPRIQHPGLAGFGFCPGGMLRGSKNACFEIGPELIPDDESRILDPPSATRNSKPANPQLNSGLWTLNSDRRVQLAGYAVVEHENRPTERMTEIVQQLNELIWYLLRDK